MKNGYGQVFLLLLGIGIVFLASSGKLLVIWGVLTGKTQFLSPIATTPQKPTMNDYVSGSGGVMS